MKILKKIFLILIILIVGIGIYTIYKKSDNFPFLTNEPLTPSVLIEYNDAVNHFAIKYPEGSKVTHIGSLKDIEFEFSARSIGVRAGFDEKYFVDFQLDDLVCRDSESKFASAGMQKKIIGENIVWVDTSSFLLAGPDHRTYVIETKNKRCFLITTNITTSPDTSINGGIQDYSKPNANAHPDVFYRWFEDNMINTISS